jgi:hypothetical protein
MDDVGSGGKRREERKKEKRWWKNSRSSGVQTVLYMYELPPIYSNPEGRKKRNVCRVNFDLFRFSLTLQLVITCRTELPTTPIMLW